MKKFIDKEKDRIVTVLNVDEAKKILEMYINYCLGKRDVTRGRLNLVNYLGDFVQYSDKKDIVRFYDILVKDKETFEFSRNDLKAYESLLSFFEIYNSIEKGEFELNNITNYINSALTKKQAIDSKVESNQELNFEEKLNNIFFNKDFDLSILAKNACQKWENILKQRIEQSSEGIDISLKEEVAYQDLLALCDSNNLVAPQVTNGVSVNEAPKNEKIEPDVSDKKEVEESNDTTKKEFNTTPQEEELQVDIDDKNNEKNSERNNERNNDKKQDEVKQDDNVVGPIIVNQVQDTEKKENKNDGADEIIGASTIREATQDVSLRDAAGMFNDAIDNLSKKNSNGSEGTNTSYGTLRDQ